jgi:hypothetical protein
MSEKQAKLGRFGVFIFATALVALSLSGQQTSHTRTSLVTDWSSRHVVFSTPTTAAKLAEVSQDPRYHQQWVRRNMHPAQPTDGEASSGATENTGASGPEEEAAASFGGWGSGGGFPSGKRKGALKGDWTTSLGPGASVGADEYPAKFSFDSTTASCANDFVVFGTGTAGAAAGASASATGTFSGSGPTNGQTATLTYGSGAVDTVTATAALKASTTGTFSGAPTSGQTLVVHGASNATFTAEDNTAATGTVTVGPGAFCIAPNQGVTIEGTSLTTNATQGSGTVTISGSTSAFSSGTTMVVIGTVTYTFVTGAPATGSATAIQVQYVSSNSGTDQANAAKNLGAAIAGNQTLCAVNPCFSSAGAANPAVTASVTTDVVSLTARCAGFNTAPTLSDNSASITTSAWTTGSNGTTTGTRFALATSGVPTATTVATQIVADVNTNTSTTTVTAANTAGVVTLTANTWGTVGNATTLTESATSGVAVSGATLSNGANATVTGNQFRIDNNDTDDAAALAAVVVSGGGPAGVTASSTGAVVTFTATAAGSAGNSITITEGLTGFTVTSPLAGGADLNSATGFFAVSDATGASISLTSIAANFATAVAAEASATGVPVTASSTGAVATVTASAAAAGSLGDGVALTETLSNFVWNHATLQGGVGQASIVAYRNLYTSCGGTVPTTAWSYFTGGTIQTSPALSLDGTQVAFVQSSSGGVANLVLLKWANASSTAGSPVTLTTSTAAAYRACVAPCMLTLPFSGGHNDSNSSVYYDYTGDVIYVGDDNGELHKFTSIFNGGTPAEFTTAPWPVPLTNSTGMQTTSPVFAINNGIYIGTGRISNGSGIGGYFYRVDPTTGAQISSAQIANDPGINDGALVDPSAGQVYVSVSTDNTNDCNFDADCSAVFQFGTAFAAASSGNEAELGSGNGFFGTVQMFAGDFDNTYFNSSDPPTGNLYACGNTGGRPILYRIHIAANVMAAPVTGPALTSAAATCSPITEADNGTVDLIFVNVQGHGSPGACGGGGCIMSFDVTSGTLPGAPTSSLAENGGTSGVIIDTLGAAAAGSNQVYFSPLGTGQVCPSAAGCAIQASQSGLN